VLVDKRSFGWDFRESIGVHYKTGHFDLLRQQLIQNNTLVYEAK
jgi:hypothetical protein